MLLATPYQDVRSIGRFLADAGYDTHHLATDLDLVEGLFANGENLQPLLMKTEGDGVLPVLARLLFVGYPVEKSRCRRVIPESILSTALDCGLLEAVNEDLHATASVAPFRDNLIAFDSYQYRSSDRNDMVGGPGISSHFIARLAAGGENETTLDLGTGSGVLAIEAAAYSRRVTGTDINERAIQFAEFTAALNGVTNAEFLCGDTFNPVAGRRFSRIIANPPFFLSPAKKFTYSDSPLELDGFARHLTKHAFEYLEPGGFYQMICQWVEIENELWENRLREWTASSGCDVLVLLAPQSTPIAYAELRDREARQAHTNPEFDFPSRVSYLRERGVRMVHSGVITMQKRSGANWFRVLGTAPAGSKVGPGLRERFDSFTFLATQSEAQLFNTTFRFAADVELSTIREPAGSPIAIDLIKTETLVDRVRLDEAVADCLPLFDGNRNLQQVSAQVAAKLEINPEEAQKRCLQLVKRLLQGSFLLPQPATT